MNKYISNFHFITNDLPGKTHVAQVQIACEAGARFVQYRCLTKEDKDLIPEINTIAEICDDWGTTLIITDHYHLLPQLDVQGVHIEKMTADFERIREEIGEGKTLGASANTFADILRIAESPVDYISCGPFSTTNTKPNKYPLVSIETYRLIVDQMNACKINIPVLAVGGVQLSDVEKLLSTGIYGVAVSAAVNVAEDPGNAVKEFRKLLRI